MPGVDHFAYGLLTPGVAYVMSFVGSLLGLHCTARARAAAGGVRAGWLTLAAISIGGTGIWVMHFIAMLGFRVQNMEIRYDVALTLLSMAVAVIVVGVGLFIVGFGGNRIGTLIAGGVVTGLGVASMHYMGMAAIKMAGHIEYSLGIVSTSIAIAVVAATVALWFTLRVRGHWVTAGAAAVMGVAVSGMHYTGMAAMEVHAPTANTGTPVGASAFDFLLPLIIGISVLGVILLMIIGLSLSEEELRFEESLRAHGLQHDSQIRTYDRVSDVEEPSSASRLSRSAGQSFGGSAY